MSKTLRSNLSFIAFALVGSFALYSSLAFLFGEPVTSYSPAVVNSTAASQAVRAAASDVYTPEFHGDEPIALGTRLSHLALEKGTHNRVHMAVTLVANEASTGARAPLNVAVVVDRSGSMAGEKLVVARESAKALVRSLQDGDVVSVVAYSDTIETLISPTRLSGSTREGVEFAISGIHATGGTNISGGLEVGADLVEAVKTADSVNRVVLLSDGRASEGAMTPSDFAPIAANMLERGIGISTVGMGLDYDEDVMQTIARAAAGRYYFVADVIETSSVFGEEMAALQGSVARNVELELKLPAGVRFVGVDGFHPRLIGDSVRFDLGTIAGGARTDMLIELDVDARNGDLVIPTELFYDDIAADSRTSRAQVARVAVSDKTRVNAEVAERVQQIRTAEAFDEAMRLYDRGNRHAAAELLEQQRRDNEAFLDDNDLDIPAFDRVSDELEELAENLRKVERHSSQGKFLSKSGKFRSNNIVQNQVVF